MDSSWFGGDYIFMETASEQSCGKSYFIWHCFWSWMCLNGQSPNGIYYSKIRTKYYLINSKYSKLIIEV